MLITFICNRVGGGCAGDAGFISAKSETLPLDRLFSLRRMVSPINVRLLGCNAPLLKQENKHRGHSHG